MLYTRRTKPVAVAALRLAIRRRWRVNIEPQIASYAVDLDLPSRVLTQLDAQSGQFRAERDPFVRQLRIEVELLSLVAKRTVSRPVRASMASLIAEALRVEGEYRAERQVAEAQEQAMRAALDVYLRNSARTQKWVRRIADSRRRVRGQWPDDSDTAFAPVDAAYVALLREGFVLLDEGDYRAVGIRRKMALAGLSCAMWLFKQEMRLCGNVLR